MPQIDPEKAREPRKFLCKGGGPLEGVVVRHYPDPHPTPHGKKYEFEDIEFEQGKYVFNGEIPEKKKKGELHWIESRHF